FPSLPRRDGFPSLPHRDGFPSLPHRSGFPSAAHRGDTPSVPHWDDTPSPLTRPDQLAGVDAQLWRSAPVFRFRREFRVWPV
ncbi:hypothetical protein ACWD4G_40300, partial [Streptomyces sp. NPDC002643]